MRIIFFVNQFPALSETFILNQITGLMEKGHNVQIYAKHPRETDPSCHPSIHEYSLLERTTYREEIPSNKLHRVLKAIYLFLKHVKKSPFVLLKSLNIFRFGKKAANLVLFYHTVSLLYMQKSDIIHAHFGPNGSLAMYLKDIGVLKGNIITSFHGYDVHVIPEEHGHNVYEHLFTRGDLFTANTEFTKNQMLDLGADPHSIQILPVGLDVNNFPFRERTPDKIIRLLTVGRLIEKKGISYSIRAVEKISSEIDNLVYKIIGDGPLKNELQELIHRLEMRDKIQLLGPMTQPEVIKHYLASEIFILPSVTAENGDMEGQGLVLQEAQATGLPVLSTYHNGIPEGLLEGISGYLVPERDVDAMVETLTKLLKNPEQWGSMGRAGRKYVEENYHIDDLNNRLLEIYETARE